MPCHAASMVNARARSCPKCGGYKGKGSQMCWRCRYGTEPRRMKRAETLIPAPVNPKVAPPWEDCPELEFRFEVVML